MPGLKVAGGPGYPPRGIGSIADATGITVQRDPMSLRETISPRKGLQNRHPIGLGADGKPWKNGLPRFLNRGKVQCHQGEVRGTGASVEGSSLHRRGR